MAISGGDGSIILTTNVDQSGLKKGLGSMVKTAKSFGAGVAKGFAVIGAAAATATVAITKMATSAYADYEQLVGGVETLFKGSAQKVVDYANDAFYTAGMSANQYMETVTGFSASLLQSLGGDTEKAADYANRAIIDMSDNANKMGTSMEMIQYAYQGFAKQNYTMLDNLKLGFGGTKTEMERLVREASQMEEIQKKLGITVDANSMSFGNVVNAISVVQEKMGIAGATAAEAEKTITGSANMMKASWQNVLSAIAGGGDLDRAINNLVYSIQKYFENIVPVVQRSLVGIGRLIEQVAPMLVQNVASALIQSIPSLINAIYQMIIGLAKGIWQGIKALFTGGSGSVTADIKTSVGGIAEQATNASTGMEELGNATEKAGKQAKKSLAAFDELNILSTESSTGGAPTATPTISGGGVGGVSSQMNIISTDDTQISFLDEIKNKLNPISEIFMSGFWKGFQNADFSQIQTSLENIGKSLNGIFSSPELQKSAQFFSSSVVEMFGQIAGSISSIGLTIATNLLGGFDIYLQSNAPFIQTSLTKIFTNLGWIASAVGDMWQAFANIFSVFAKSNGQQLTANIIGIFGNAQLGIITLATSIGKDFINLLTQPIVENQEGLKTVLDGLLGTFATFTSGVKTLVDDLVGGVLLLYDEHISPLIQILTESLSGFVEQIVEGFNTHIKPVLDEFAKQFVMVVNDYVSPMVDKVMEFVGDIIDIISWLWKNILEPIVSWIIDVFVKAFSRAFSIVGDVVLTVIKFISGMISSLMDIFNGIIDFFTGTFTGNWKKAWQGLSNIFKGIINGIITIFEGMINFIVNGINVFVSGLDTVVSAVGSIFGADWGVPKIPTVSIPRLAQGAVIPPNREFLAVLGDQKQGTNIEAPLDTIKQAVAEVLAQVNTGFGGSIEVPVIIDGREVARAVRNAESNMGTQTVFGGFANAY